MAENSIGFSRRGNSLCPLFDLFPQPARRALDRQNGRDHRACIEILPKSVGAEMHIQAMSPVLLDRWRGQRNW